MYFMTKALDEYTGMGLMSIRRGSWGDVGSFALVLLVYSFLLRSMGVIVVFQTWTIGSKEIAWTCVAQYRSCSILLAISCTDCTFLACCIVSSGAWEES